MCGKACIRGMRISVGMVVEDGLICCHMASAQPTLAVATHHRCQRTLTKRLGVAPAEKTTRLYLAAIEGHSTRRP